MLNNKKVFEDYLNEDHLVRVKDLESRLHSIPGIGFNEIEKEDYLFKPLLTEKQEVWVRPKVNYKVMKYLREEENIASVRVDKINPKIYDYTSGRSGALVRGVSFEPAIKIALEKGFIKCAFHAETPGVHEWGVSGYLEVHLDKTVAEGITTLNLQAWQGNDSDVDYTVQYIHAIFPGNMRCCQHLDGATMELDLDSRRKLFYNGIYCKNRSSYQKLFRLDGTISWELFYKIVESYFVFDKLTDECFAYKEIPYLIKGLSDDKHEKIYKTSLKDLN